MESKLQVLEIIGEGEIFGFESIIFDVYGKGFYIGFSDGWIVCYDGLELGWIIFVIISMKW